MSTAEIYKLDGPIIVGSEPFSSDEVAAHYKTKDPTAYIPPPLAPVVRDIPKRSFISPKEAWNLAVKSRSAVDPFAFDYLWNREADIYGVTGRPNKKQWIDLTMKTLHKGLIGTRFINISFRPEEVSGIQSKGAAIAELVPLYDDIIYFDDDKYVVFGLAKLFEKQKKVKFKLVQGLGEGVLAPYAEKRFDNVQRIAQLVFVEPKTTFTEKTLPEGDGPSVFEKRMGLSMPFEEQISVRIPHEPI